MICSDCGEYVDDNDQYYIEMPWPRMPKVVCPKCANGYPDEAISK